MRKRITTEGARNTLLGTWFVFLLLNLVIVFYMYLDDWIEDDTLWASLSQLNSLYVTYLGLMVAFYFTSRASSRRGGKKTGMPFLIALTGSVLWNLILTIFVLKAFLLRGDKHQIYGLDDATKQIGQIIPLLSWIVAPTIGYFFGASATTQSAATDHH